MYFDRHEIKAAIQSRDHKKLARMYDGTDYDQGKLETLDRTIDNIAQGLSKLIIGLVEAKVITEEQAEKIANYNYTVEMDKDD